MYTVNRDYSQRVVPVLFNELQEFRILRSLDGFNHSAQFEQV